MSARARLPGLRMQLALLYTLVFAVLMLIGGTVFYQTVRVALAEGFDTELRIHTDQIAGGVSLQDNGRISVIDATGELLDLQPTPTPAIAQPTPTPDANAPSPSPVPPANTGAAVSFGTLVRVVDLQGNPVYTSPAFHELVVPRVSISQALAGNPWGGTIQARNGQDVRLYSEPQYRDDGTVFAVVQVGESLTPLNANLQSVLIPLLLIFPVVLLLDGIGCYWLAGRAFNPLNRLTRTAQQIQASAMTERVIVPAANDEVRRLALTFNAMIDRLEAAFARQQRFVADASHELRTPVAAIRSLSEVTIARATTLEEYAAALRGVVGEAERLSDLIRDLLMLARADEGELALHVEPLQLDVLVADVVATAQPLAAAQGITLRAELLPVQVVGDEARLIQVVMNLVDNALQYTDAGGTVIVQTRVAVAGAQIMVQDTGIGISETDQAHIFERFYRADAARSRRTGGTGLGLALVAWLVRAHGGTMIVNSIPGEGSRFTMTLPVAGAQPPT